MIANKSAADRKVSGNLIGEDIKMGVADIAHILNVVTDLYSDRELACIREYSTNALDAHIEAGVTAPIEVSTPGPLAPFLTIRDYGVGLALDDIREIYSQYGASTKRSTNAQTGMLGLGCKSALTYSDQFTVTSVKDGVRIQVVVSRNAQGASMKVVDTADTSDPNGTTVMIPARGFNAFRDKAEEFFKHWRPGTVKLNGVEPAFMPDVKWVTDDICINESEGYNPSSTVVMGGVPYPVDIDHGLGYGKSITAFVSIGAVDFAPSRESVMDTDTTTATLKSVEQSFRAGMHKAIREDIESCSTPAEAARKTREWKESVGGGNMPASIQYKGEDVPDFYQFSHDTIHTGLWSRKASSHAIYRKDQWMPLLNVSGALWVTGFDYAKFTATVKKKMVKYMEDKDLSAPSNFFLTASDATPDTTWVEELTIVDWPTVKAIKLPKATRSNISGRIPGSYDVWESGDLNQDIPADDIDTTGDLFWMIGRPYSGRWLAEHLNESYPGCTLVMMRSGREDKFKRNFPTAKEAQSVIKHDFQVWKDGISKEDALAMYMRDNADRRLEHLDTSRLDDPSISKAKKVLDRDLSKLDNEINAWNKLGFRYQVGIEADVDSPLDKYPLLPESYYFPRYLKANEAHIYRYMNAEYAHLKDQA